MKKIVKLSEIVSNMPCAYGDEVGVNSINLPVAKVSNIDHDGNFHKEFEMRSFNRKQADNLVVKEGDLLVVKSSGSKTNVLSGKTGYCSKEHEGQLVPSNFLLCLRPDKKKVVPKYLWYFLNSKYSKSYVLKIVGATTYPNLKWDTYSEQPIPFYSIEKQNKIVGLLDKADAIRRKRQESIKLADEFLRSVFLDMFGDPVTNPKKWPSCKLRDVLNSIESGWSPKCLDEIAQPSNWGVLKLSAVTKCEYDQNENKALPDGIEPRSSIEVKSGDLLFSRKNTYELIAACAFVFETRSRLMLSDTIFRLDLKQNSNVIAEYLWAMMVSSGKRKQIQSLANGSSGSMPNISKTRLLNQNIEVPPISLQKKFREVLYKTREKRCKDIFALQSSSQLFNSLSSRAFNGEL